MGVLFGENEISADSQTGLKLEGQLYKGGHMAGNRRMKAFFSFIIGKAMKLNWPVASYK